MVGPPVLAVTGARTGPPMIVGPITLLTFPMLGPLNARTSPHACCWVEPPAAPLPCAVLGEVAERSNAAVSKTVRGR